MEDFMSCKLQYSFSGCQKSNIRKYMIQQLNKLTNEWGDIDGTIRQCKQAFTNRFVNSIYCT